MILKLETFSTDNAPMKPRIIYTFDRSPGFACGGLSLRIGRRRFGLLWNLWSVNHEAF